MKKPIATVGLACGRLYLSVNGIVVAVETDVVRDISIASVAKPEECLKDEDGYLTNRVRWNSRLLQVAADHINGKKKLY